MNLPKSITESLAQANISIVSAELVTGGDINEARKITTAERKEYFIKFNQNIEGKQILYAELKGLELLQKHDVPTPRVVHSELNGEIPYLLLGWIPSGQRDDMELAVSLAQLHKTTANNFGLDHSNYIGALPQTNTWTADFYSFYVVHRLEAQLRLAKDQGFSFKLKLEKLESVIRNLIPPEKPALIHGDLWAGNVMDGPDGTVFIDPSVSYCHREMDLAMMLLFGGYDEAVFRQYNELYPLEKDWRKRKDIFQLYYLFVHLNLFGSSYYNSVDNILKKYLR